MALKSFNNANSEDARRGLLDSRTERKHPKRHRTLNRSKRMAKAKRAKVKAKCEMLKKQRSEFLVATRAYWAGEDIGYPRGS